MGFRWQNHRQVTFGADLAENEATKKMVLSHGIITLHVKHKYVINVPKVVRI